LSLIQSSDIAWQVSRYSTRRNCICKSLMTVSVTNWIISLTLWIFTYKISSCTRDNSVCHWYSHQTLLGKFQDIVQEEILYVKSHKVREIIQFVTDTVIRHCWQVSRCSTRRNYWIISLTLWLFTCKISSCTTSRDLLSNVW
jgi:hypothetical protein